MPHMPYHVEVRRPRRHARLFNLGEDELRRTVLDPWARGGPLSIGGQRWERRESTLRILEGPELSATDLAFGQGWNAAERTAEDRTAELLAGPGAGSVAVLAADLAGEHAAAALLEELGVDIGEWSTLREALLAWLADPTVAVVVDVAAVVIVCGSEAPDGWLFDAGLALGALGRRAVLVAPAGAAIAPVMGALGRLDLEHGADALAERLRRAGCRIPPR
jgi:hypothetical protein